MTHHLIVKQPFGDYSRGDRVTDPAEVATLLAVAGEHVVRVQAPPSDGADASALANGGSSAG